MGATNFEAMEVKVTSTKGHIFAIGTACVHPRTPSQSARCCDCVGKTSSEQPTTSFKLHIADTSIASDAPSAGATSVANERTTRADRSASARQHGTRGGNPRRLPQSRPLANQCNTPRTEPSNTATRTAASVIVDLSEFLHFFFVRFFIVELNE
jgi:hypothetical protein